MTGTLRVVGGDATLPVGTDPRVIVHICNDLGAWGRGFVLPLGKRYPVARARYLAWAKGQEDLPFELGQVQFVGVQADLYVANLLGQRGIARRGGAAQEPPIRYEAVRAGLGRVRDFVQGRGASVHMPRIGTGLAGGDWRVIQKIIEEELLAPGVSVTVYDLP